MTKVPVFPEIVIPNGFSPNGDGKNDTWILDLIYLFPNNEVEVYNRWGEQLFYSKGYNTPFNGQYQGKDWTDKKNWKLNAMCHPSRKNSFYGHSILPYEVIFHKWYWHGSENVNFEIIKEYLNQFDVNN